MILIIVESPNKISKIKQYLDKNYEVAASVGHVSDLDKNTLSVDVNNNFKPIYVINEDKIKVVKNLKSLAKKAQKVILCCDPDREGEMISYLISDILKLNNPMRVTFTSITKTEIQKAFLNPRPIDMNLVFAATARRVIDRLVGYELSPLISNQLQIPKLSAGRVMSVTCRLVCDRENEIKKFMAGEFNSFFKFTGNFISNKKSFASQLYKLEGKNKDNSFKGQLDKINGETLSRDFLTLCMKSKFKVEFVFSKKRMQSPQTPFTTSSLQQSANRKLGFGGKRTMTAGQKLYESGLITYIRTDSINISNDAMENIKQFVIQTYGNEYYNKKEYKSKKANTQEGHESIHVTDCFVTSIVNDISGKLGYDEKKLYSLIFKNTVASQMKPAEFNVTSIQISISEVKDKFFMTNIENLVFQGYLIVYNVSNIEKNNDEEKNDDEDNQTNKDIEIPKVNSELIVDIITGKQTYISPPGRFNYSSLIDKLVHLSIGRPATYVSIIEKLVEKKYIEIRDNEGIQRDSLVLSWKFDNKIINEVSEKITLGKEKGKYTITNLGVLITNYLVIYFPKIMDYQFTSEMENRLDEICTGKLVWYEVLKEFYNEFHPIIEQISMKKMTEIEEKYTRLLGKDPKTGFEIYSTTGKHGPYVKLIHNKSKPKSATIELPLTLETITLDDAIKLLEYPKELGIHNKIEVLLHKGRNGFFIKNGEIKANVEKENLTLSEAIEILKNIDKKLGTYKKNDVLLKKGPHGFYIMNGTNKASVENENITLEEAIEVLKIKEKGFLKTITTDTKTYKILDGQYGKYINVIDMKTNKRINVSLPKNEDIEKLTVKRITEIISNKYNKDSKYSQSENKKKDIKAVPVKKNIPKNISKKVIKKAKKQNVLIEQ